MLPDAGGHITTLVEVITGSCDNKATDSDSNNVTVSYDGITDSYSNNCTDRYH